MKYSKYLQNSLILIVFLILFVGKSAISQTIINEGNVYGKWNKENSPYLINGNISIPLDSNLTIGSGVVVKFQGQYNLTIFGNIKVKGELNDSVKFSTSDTITGWLGIKIIGPSNDTNVFNYSIIEQVKAGTTYPEMNYGAISIENNAILKITSSRISNNSMSETGSGLKSLLSNLIVEKSIFKNNSNTSFGGCIYSNGSYIYLVENYFMNNTSDFSYGGYGYGGAIYSYFDSSMVLLNNKFIKNYSNYGAGADIENCKKVIIKSCIFESNQTIQEGGAIRLRNCKADLINNLICNNTVVSNSYYSSGGGGIKVLSSNIRSINNTIANNSGYGLYIGNTDIDLINTIISSNEGFYSDKKNIRVDDFDGTKWSGLNVNNSILNGGLATIDCYNNYDTLIRDTTNFIFSVPSFQDSEELNYRLDFNSNAYNKGVTDTTGLNLPESDLDGIFRIVNDTIDIGAYEFNNTVKNRVPKISQIPDYVSRINDTLNFSVVYSDADIADLHAIRIYSSDTNLRIENISGDTSKSTFSVVPDINWSGKAIVTIVVSDNSGAENFSDSITFATYIANSFNLTDYELTRDMVWNTDTIKIFQDTKIDKDILLSILPGNYIEFQGAYSLIFHGQLIAEGNQSDSIYFNTKTNNTDLKWGTLSFPYDIAYYYNLPEFISTMKYCVVKNASTGVSIMHAKNFLISNCDIKNNLRGIFCESGAIINDCKIHNNKSNFPGTGLYLSSYNINPVKVINCRIYNNISTSTGGGLNIHGDVSLIGNQIYDNYAKAGGGIALSTYGLQPMYLVNNTIAFNNSENGGGIFQGDCYNEIMYINNILQYNTAQYSGSQLYAAYSGRVINFINNYIEGGIDDVFVAYDKSELNSKENYFSNSLFVDSSEKNFNLQNSSICINAGSFDSIFMKYFEKNLLDYLLVNDNKIDIGALEFIGIPDNRLPIIDRRQNVFIRKDKISTLEIKFKELDSADSNYVEIFTDTSKVEVNNVKVLDSKILFELSPNNNYSGNLSLRINLYDKVDSLAFSNSDTLNIIVSNTFEYCGLYNDDILWDADTVLINCDVKIGENACLTIESGTYIKFTGEYGLIIDGLIKANGVQHDSIIFTSSVNNWSSIIINRFSDFSKFLNDSSYFDYCIIENTNSQLNYDAGGGLTIRRSELALRNSHISDNIYYGISIEYNSNPLIKNNYFTKNIGTGIKIDGSPKIIGNIFENNSTLNMYGRGAAIWALAGTPKIQDNIFRFNKGGAIECGGTSGELQAWIINNDLYSNYPNDGFGGSGITFKYSRGQGSYIIGNLIYNNISSIEGAGISINEVPIYNPIYVYNNDIINNVSSMSGGGVLIGRSSNVILKNNVLWGNTAKNATDQISIGYLYSSAKIDNCLIEHGIDSLRGWEDGFDRVESSNILKENPAFYNYFENNFRLLSVSPCVNSGTVDTSKMNLPEQDIIGNPRISENKIDIGAYEYAKSLCNLNISNIKEDICFGDRYSFENHNISEGGKYYIAYDKNGCDSIIYLDLKVNPLPEITLGNDTIIEHDEKIILNVSNDYSNIQWSNGITSNQIIVDSNMGIGNLNIWVAVLDTLGCENSDTINITIKDIYVDKINSTHNFEFKVYPNPSQGFLNIQFDKELSNTANITLHDINGKLIYNQLLGNSKQIDLTSFNAGIYILSIINDDVLICKKEIIVY